MYKSAKARGKKVIGGILCGLLMAGQLLLPQAPGMQEVLAAPFTMGTQNHWAEQYMRKLFDEGIMRGISMEI